MQRFLTAQKRLPVSPEAVDASEPFVLSVEGSGGPRIAVANEAAQAIGLLKGDLLSDARAKAGVLQVRPLTPLADHAALKKLAFWATRYAPAVALWNEENGADGFFIDITGASHLFGSERALLLDLAGRLAGFGLVCRVAVAQTPGMAWALAHYASSPCSVLPAGEEQAALSPLPVEALRLSGETCALLHRLGLRRVGAVAEAPRAPFAARFETSLLRRLDQALGRLPESLDFLATPPAYEACRQVLEPISSQTGVVKVTTRLMQDLVPALQRDGKGARALRLWLYRVDGAVRMIHLGLAAPTRDPAHVARLVELNLERLGENIDAGFGFETLRLGVTLAAKIGERQTAFGALRSVQDEPAAARQVVLLDSYRQRLGPRSVQRLQPAARHLPERAQEIALTDGNAALAWPRPERLRPSLILEAVEAMAVVGLDENGLPRGFTWRGASHEVRRWQGPERIAGEWWREKVPRPDRDYYLAETAGGERYWLYREVQGARRWFLHGLFA